MPPIPTQNTWTPDIIATVVYRFVMAIVSLLYIWRKYRQPLGQNDLTNSEEIREPSPVETADSNDILQAVQSFGALALTILGTDGDGALDPPPINLVLQQGQNSNPNRRQVGKSSRKD